MEIIALSGIPFLLFGCSSVRKIEPPSISAVEDVVAVRREEVKCLDGRLLQAKIKAISDAVQELLDNIKKKSKGGENMGVLNNRIVQEATGMLNLVY